MTPNDATRHVKAALAGLSLANLCFLPSWSELLYSPNTWFFSDTVPTAQVYLACLIDVLLLSVLFWAVIEVWFMSTNRWIKTSAKIVLWAALFEALNNFRGFSQFLISPLMVAKYGPTPVLYVSIVLLVVVVALIWKGHRHLTGVIIEGLVILSLAAFWNIVNVGVKYVEFKKTPQGVSTRKHEVAENSGPRVIWIIFDELDERLALRERPDDVPMPALDALVKQSISATRATSPTGSTLTSIPSLITGQFVLDSHEASPEDLHLDFESGAKGVAWVTQSNFFSQAYEAGHNAAVVGWYIPYCRIFSGVLSKCSTYGFYELGGDRSSVTSEMARQMRSVNSIRFEFLRSHFGQKWNMHWMEPRTHKSWVMRFKKILNDAETNAVDPDVDALYVHFSIPHFPVIYNRGRQEFSESGDGTYLDNLVLVDHALQQMMQAMKTAGVWDKTTVLVSSDHWFRFRADESNLFVGGKNVDRHVPFILKMAGQSKPLNYEKPFNTILTKELMLSVLNREVKSPADALSWITKHASDHAPLTGPIIDRLSSHHAP